MMFAIGMYVFGFVTHVLFSIEQRNKRPRSKRTRAAATSNAQYKMVLVVNNSLKMGKGKIGAQCAHAAVGAVECAPEEIMVRWKSQGQPKVCLQAQQDVILQLERRAKAKAMTCCLVRDAGRTQIAPGSKTVLAIGPDTIDNINELTGSLKLL